MLLLFALLAFDLIFHFRYKRQRAQKSDNRYKCTHINVTLLTHTNIYMLYFLVYFYVQNILSICAVIVHVRRRVSADFCIRMCVAVFIYLFQYLFVYIFLGVAVT